MGCFELFRLALGAATNNPESDTVLPVASASAQVASAGRLTPQYISTSYVERQNLSMRMSIRRFTRLTNTFSEKFETHCHMVAIQQSLSCLPNAARDTLGKLD